MFNLDIDSIKTVLDIGLGTVALIYVHKLQRLLDNHDTRISRVEKKLGF